MTPPIAIDVFAVDLRKFLHSFHEFLADPTVSEAIRDAEFRRTISKISQAAIAADLGNRAG